MRRKKYEPKSITNKIYCNKKNLEKNFIDEKKFNQSTLRKKKIDIKCFFQKKGILAKQFLHEINLSTKKILDKKCFDQKIARKQIFSKKNRSFKQKFLTKKILEQKIRLKYFSIKTNFRPKKSFTRNFQPKNISINKIIDQKLFWAIKNYRTKNYSGIIGEPL